MGSDMKPGVETVCNTQAPSFVNWSLINVLEVSCLSFFVTYTITKGSTYSSQNKHRLLSWLQSCKIVET